MGMLSRLPIIPAAVALLLAACVVQGDGGSHAPPKLPLQFTASVSVESHLVNKVGGCIGVCLPPPAESTWAWERVLQAPAN